jgi:CO/xanthine dehydrogenase Mo-binding subunit
MTDRHVRQDGREKVTGLGRYTADLTRTGMLHAAFRYADHTHARILRIDAARARAVPGVHAVVTHEDVPDLRYGIAVRDRRLFARDKVRFEGDVIAAVAARTRAIARAAAALVEVDYEPLPALADYERAMDDDAPQVHEDWASYDGDRALGRHGNLLAYATIATGDVDAALAAADQVVRGRYVADISHGVPIEPRAIVAEWAGDRVTIWSSTQVPFIARDEVARVLTLPQSHVRVIVPLLGGGFGAKCNFHFEAHVAALARAARRPVRLAFGRREEFTAVDHRREGMVIELESGVTHDGRIVARRARLVLDGGAYCGEGGFMAQLAAMHVCGPYRLGAVDVRSSLVYSNNQPSASIRAPTAPQTCWALEQHVDALAAAIGMDPVELRRRNLIREGDRSPTGQVFERIGALETLERAAALIGHGAALPDDESIGFACGWWPSYGASSGAFVKLNADGTGVIVTGATETGTGAVMGLPLLVAEVLGMRPDDFAILYQDTDAGPWDKGASGSQTTFNNGRAVIAAAAEVRDALLDLAADRLEASRDDLELAAGCVAVKGSPDRSVAIAELASSGGTIIGKGGCESPPPPAAPDVEGCVGRLGHESFLAPQLFTHAARVRVDRDTGVVRVLAIAAVHDSGAILNRIGADGQVYGGVTMGIGQALLERVQLEEDGRLRNPDLVDYKLITAADTPEIRIAWVETPTANAGPNGAKGVGEPPCIPTAGAIANAISNALGCVVTELPMTPERVWLALRAAATTAEALAAPAEPARPAGILP